MRADLQTMEQIDLYLQGKMTAAESAVFENSMALNPELGKLVADQQLLAQTVSRKALLAEINLVAVGGGGGAWYTNPFVGLAGATIVVGIIAATIYYSSDSETQDPINSTNVSEQTVENNSDLISENNTENIEGNTGLNPNDNSESVKTEKFPAPTFEDDDDANEDLRVPYQNGDQSSDNNLGDQNGEHDDVNYDASSRKVKNKLACFPNGYQAMTSYVKERIIYPGTAKKEKIQGNVKVQFLVGVEGQISTIQSNCFKLRDENDKPLSATQMVLNQKIVKLFEDKSTATIRTMPSWEPATDSQGNNVVSTVTVYFNYSLKDGISIYQLDDAADN